MQIITTNLGGNLHVAGDTINEMGLAEYLVTMSFTGSATVAVFKVPDEIAPLVREYFKVLPEYRANKPAKKWA